MKTRIILLAIAATATLSLDSCVQQVAAKFVRNEYPGPRPTAVIRDVNGQPASNKWLQSDPNSLPPSSLINTNVKYGAGNIPYGIISEYSNIVVSPYAPHNQLDYTGVKVGEKVWDPYTRKPFYIPRSYTVN